MCKTLSDRIIRDQVGRAITRAYRVAESIQARRPGLAVEIEVEPATHRGGLPDLLALISVAGEGEPAESIRLRTAMTAATMHRVVSAAVDRLATVVQV